MYGGSWSLNGTMRIIFSLECPPSAKLLLESSDGAIKLLQLAQRSESSPKLWQRLWMPETNEIVGTPIILCPMLIFSFLLCFSSISCPYFVQLVSPSKVSQKAQPGVFGATFCALLSQELHFVQYVSWFSFVKSVSDGGWPWSYILFT